MPGKFLNLLAAATLAVIACSYGPEQVVAVSPESHADVFARHGAHHDLAKKMKRHARRADTTKCRARDSSSSSSTTSSSADAAYSSAPASSGSDSSYSSSPSGSGSSGSSGGSSSNTYTAPQQSSSNTYTGGSGGGKACLAWPNGDTGNLAQWKTSHVSLMYTWSSWPVAGASAAGFNVIPQLWGDKDTYDYSQNIGKYTTPTWILGFNEPNEPGQSNMTPDHAVELWWKYMEPQRANGHKLVSPAVSGSPEGFEWMKSFFAKCSGCHIDMVATHWYDVKAADFIAYQQKYHDQFGLPIIVTEFACQNFNGGAQCSMGDIWDFMGQVTSWMDNTDWIVNYCYFGAMHDMFNVNYDNQLMGSDGGPNALGYRFINGH